MDQEIQQDVVIEAQRIILASVQEGISLRLIGGTAIFGLSNSFKDGPLYRKCHDIDLVGLSKQSREIRELIESFGYQSDKRFNALHGQDRLLFFDPVNNRDLDVFLDHLLQCHDLLFTKRIALSDLTLPPADILLSKLQVVDINIKDIRDVICLLQDCRIGDSDEGVINQKYISKLLGDNWGFWKTVTINLERIASYMSNEFEIPNDFEIAQKNLETLRELLNVCPKSLRWKLRNVIGERVIWYEVPEDRSQMR